MPKGGWVDIPSTDVATCRAFIADLLDDLAHHIDAGATTEGWLRFAAHWSDKADDL